MQHDDLVSNNVLCYSEIANCSDIMYSDGKLNACNYPSPLQLIALSFDIQIFKLICDSVSKRC